MFMFIFSRASTFKFLWVYFSDIDECNAANNSCHENAWCNNTQGSFDCFCKPGYDGDGHNCTGKIIYMLLVNVRQSGGRMFVDLICLLYEMTYAHFSLFTARLLQFFLVSLE